jgi:preprotein translocase subunit YajC
MINRPNGSKPLLVIIAILLLANIGGLAYFLASKPTHKKKQPVASMENGNSQLS